MKEESKNVEKEDNNKEEVATTKEKINGGETSTYKQKRFEETKKPRQPRMQQQQKRFYFRKKVCRLCVNKVKVVDYKNVEQLRRFVTETGKILPRRITGTCARHQRMLAKAVKRARMIALLPYV